MLEELAETARAVFGARACSIMVREGGELVFRAVAGEGGDSGKPITAHFCPHCGTTVYWELGIAPDLIAVAAGAFADPDFPPPRHSVYESRRHSWTLFANDQEMEHLA